MGENKSPHPAIKFQDYYEKLGVARNASAEELKLAFRKLARIHHPDIAKDKVAGEARFKEINEAYEVLGDPVKRQRYDELGTDWRGDGRADASPGRHSSRDRSYARRSEPDVEFSGTGFSDFFESYFAGAGAAFTHPGADVETDLLVTLAEALHGATRKITLRRPGADGATERTETYQVKIPAGVREGKRIRLAGQGGAGLGGAAAGDLFLRVRLALHPDFTPRDADLHCDVDLAPWEAVLGVRARIPTLDGTMVLRVPPGTAADSQLRLRGLGLRRDDGTRGDIYATMKVQTPHPISADELALWTQLAQLSTFHPRKVP